MPELVDLTAHRIIAEETLQEQLVRALQGVVDSLSQSIQAREVNSFVAVAIGVDGSARSYLASALGDEIAMLGALAVLKDDLLLRLQDRRHENDIPPSER